MSGVQGGLGEHKRAAGSAGFGQIRPSCANSAVLWQGSLKDTFCNHLKHVAFFNTKTKGNHHLQGNVQVYNVRIPV